MDSDNHRPPQAHPGAPTVDYAHRRYAPAAWPVLTAGGKALILTVIGGCVLAFIFAIAERTQHDSGGLIREQEMNKLAGAIDQYFLEFNHEYPGPFTNAQVTSASVAITNVNGGAAINPTSTENMVLGLCGGLDLKRGTIVYNSSDIQAGLGPLNLDPNPNKQTRHVALMDATPGQHMPDLPWDGGNGIQGPSDSCVPEFIDRSNAYNGGKARPILYLRARVGNPTNSGTAPFAQVCAGNDSSNQYNYTHLRPYATASDFFGFSPAIGGAGGTIDATKGGNKSVAPYVVRVGISSTTWDRYLGNPNQFSSPRGVNAYILISAGADGVFGTEDDLFYP